MSVEYNPLPPQQWVKEAPNRDLHLCDSVDGRPLRGYGFDQEPTRPPMAFEQDMYGYQDGMLFWHNANEDSNDTVEVTVLLTDPSRPDGLGKTGEFKKFAGRYDIIGHTATRGVVFAAQQHGLGKRRPLGLYLGDDTSHPEYTGQLQEAVDELGTPAFSFTPSTGSDLVIPTRILQRGRKMVYDLAREQGDLRHPSMALCAADMVHTGELGHAMLSEAGLKLRKYIDNDEVNFRPFPTKILLVAPGEQGNIADNLGVAMGVPPEDDVTIKTGMTVPEAMERGTDMYWYAQAKSMGYIPHEEPR